MREHFIERSRGWLLCRLLPRLNGKIERAWTSLRKKENTSGGGRGLEGVGIRREILHEGSFEKDWS